MSAPTKSYDPRCLELAELFLEDEPLLTTRRAPELAAHIQSEIEDWIEYERSQMEPHGDLPTFEDVRGILKPSN